MRPLPLLQTLYWQSPASLATAKLIIGRKLRNMAYLLKRLLPYRVKKYPDQAQILNTAIIQLQTYQTFTNNATARQQLMLTEGRAARCYWQATSRLMRCPQHWQRVHPHAQDIWNTAFNIGYTMLGNIIRRAVDTTGLSKEIGVLHAPKKGHEALVYDLEELFRQPIIDTALITEFSRRAHKTIKPESITRTLARALTKKIKYSGCHIQLTAVIQKELQSYIQAMRKNISYTPYIHSWSHEK